MFPSVAVVVAGSNCKTVKTKVRKINNQSSKAYYFNGWSISWSIVVRINGFISQILDDLNVENSGNWFDFYKEAKIYDEFKKRGKNES